MLPYVSNYVVSCEINVRLVFATIHICALKQPLRADFMHNSTHCFYVFLSFFFPERCYKYDSTPAR